MAKRIGVVLAGCGVYDGAEIHEAVLTLLAIDRAGAEAVCIAPDIDQLHVVNHLTGDVMHEKRNVLVEAARIARGKITDLSAVDIADLDAVVLPGGYGAAKNLCNFAVKGADCEILPEVSGLLRAALEQRKPVGVACIAPTVLARALKDSATHVTVTIGDDAGVASGIEKMGARHRTCSEGDIVVDEALKVVSTPAYMYDSRISDVAKGIDRMVTRVIEMA